MARQLEARLEELQLERARLQETVRRVGESLGKGLDRDALLGIVVQTAVDGVGAEGGRVVMRQAGNGDAGRGRARRRVSALHGGGAGRRGGRAGARRGGRDADRRRQRAGAAAAGARAGGRRARRHLDRPPRAAVHRAPARALRLSHQPGGDLDRERRPARDDPAPGGHGRAHRPVQPSPLPGGHGRRRSSARGASARSSA